MKYSTRVLIVLSAFAWTSVATADPADEKPAAPYSPTLRSSFPDQVLWGDLHLHSNLSMDAFSLGNTALSPDEAYRFAKGDTINSTVGGPAKLSRPLDFLSVTDHAEYLGALAGLTDPAVSQWTLNAGENPGFWARIFGKSGPTMKESLEATPVGRRWSQNLKDGEVLKIMTEFANASGGIGEIELIPEALQTTIWQRVAAVADKHNAPGRFTALVGYEWTTMYEGNNLHRVVLYKDGSDIAGKIRPFSTLDSPDPEDLWTALENYEAETGGKVLAIPHNGNLSNGAMFSETTLKGEPMNIDYAKRRARWEPIYEVTQVKGDGEAHPKLSPDDEFADFENWDAGNISMQEVKTDDMLEYEYGRSALNVGLRLEDELGVNPYKFGFIGSTDSHTGLATSDNNNFFGKFPGSEPTVARITNKMAGVLWPNVTVSSTGYTAVWAKENTREAIFDALQRKEVYASTGPRITLRFFAGWDFDTSDLYASNFADRAYAKGVPMGGTLEADDAFDASDTKAPIFLIHAMRDPLGANLDRVQIIKGWVDKNGQTQETIYDVSLSDGRVIGPSGKAPSVGNTVDVKTATYSNDIGSPVLSAAWSDPDFDASLDAFYYARVLEIPTPRWSTYDAVRFNVDPPVEVPATLQERAYSSPIWYETEG